MAPECRPPTLAIVPLLAMLPRSTPHHRSNPQRSAAIIATLPRQTPPKLPAETPLLAEAVPQSCRKHRLEAESVEAELPLQPWELPLQPWGPAVAVLAVAAVATRLGLAGAGVLPRGYPPAMVRLEQAEQLHPRGRGLLSSPGSIPTPQVPGALPDAYPQQD